MNYLINILLIISCLWLTFEDFKNRQISLWLLIVTAVMVVGSFILNRGAADFKEVLMNISLVAFLFLFFMLISYRRGVNIFDLIGEGDWLVLLLFAFSFKLFDYTAFIMVSYIAAIFLTLLQRIIRKGKTTIPLAGILCLAFALHLSIKLFINESISYLSFAL